MNISVTIPTDLEPFVRSELASGAISSEDELVARALVLYREMKGRHEQLRLEVARSREQGRRGEVAELDIEEVIARGYERFAKQDVAD